MDREAWHAAIHEVAKIQTRLSDWTELNVNNLKFSNSNIHMKTICNIIYFIVLTQITWRFIFIFYFWAHFILVLLLHSFLYIVLILPKFYMLNLDFYANFIPDSLWNFGRLQNHLDLPFEMRISWSLRNSYLCFEEYLLKILIPIFEYLNTHHVYIFFTKKEIAEYINFPNQ